ncbi:uncharacterized protein IWZ02DRAFT_510547 [Phyllosticta citriasiana]|uniref:uncharacterized protein n=1 Tax=Phyllosticta citriasiana TaxID=595635 RepID=UPI0030FDAAF4
MAHPLPQLPPLSYRVEVIAGPVGKFQTSFLFGFLSMAVRANGLGPYLPMKLVLGLPSARDVVVRNGEESWILLAGVEGVGGGPGVSLASKDHKKQKSRFFQAKAQRSGFRTRPVASLMMHGPPVVYNSVDSTSDAQLFPLSSQHRQVSFWSSKNLNASSFAHQQQTAGRLRGSPASFQASKVPATRDLVLISIGNCKKKLEKMSDIFGGYINNTYVEAGSSLATTNGPTWRRGPVADPRVDHAVREVHQAEHESQRVGASLFQFKEQTMRAEIDALRSQLNKAETWIKRHKSKEIEYQNEIQVLENNVEDLKKNAAYDRERIHRLKEDLRRGGKYFPPAPQVRRASRWRPRHGGTPADQSLHVQEARQEFGSAREGRCSSSCPDWTSELRSRFNDFKRTASGHRKANGSRRDALDP